MREGGRVSGEKLGRTVGISRTAVWKYIAELRREGYQISSSPRLGYSLISAPDELLPEEIKGGLNTNIMGKQIIHYREISSTQDIAKALAAQGADEGVVVVAERQTQGRGRMGRNWFSLPGSICLSLILRPELKPLEALKFPLIAGVGAAQAINKLTGLRPELKWPNDLILGGKKVGGILAELSAETDRVIYIVLGIGINVNTPRNLFPEEIEAIATSLKEECGKEVSRVKLVQAILVELESLYEELKFVGFEPIRQKWKSLSNTIGFWVRVSNAKEEIEGEAIDIDQEGALILRKASGSLQRIIAGEVTLRKEVNRGGNLGGQV